MVPTPGLEKLLQQNIISIAMKSLQKMLKTRIVRNVDCVKCVTDNMWSSNEFQQWASTTTEKWQMEISFTKNLCCISIKSLDFTEQAVSVWCPWPEKPSGMGGIRMHEQCAWKYENLQQHKSTRRGREREREKETKIRKSNLKKLTKIAVPK